MKRANVSPPYYFLQWTASSQTPSIHVGTVPVLFHFSRAPPTRLMVSVFHPWTVIMQHIVPDLNKQTNKKRPSILPSSELMYHHTQTNKMTTRSDLKSGEMELCLMTINFDLKHLSWLLQEWPANDVHVSEFMLNTIISNLYVLHKTIITVILKNAWLYSILYRIIPLNWWTLLPNLDVFGALCIEILDSFGSTYQNELLFCIY